MGSKIGSKMGSKMGSNWVPKVAIPFEREGFRRGETLDVEHLEKGVVTSGMTYMGISSRRNAHVCKFQVRRESPRGSGNERFAEAKQPFP